MEKYNDFPILEEKQYFDLNDQYQKDEQQVGLWTSQILGNLYSFFEFAKHSTLKTSIKKNLQDETMQLIDNINQSFPDIEAKTTEKFDNIFLAINSIVNCLKIIEKIKNISKNQKNIIFCNNFAVLSLNYLNKIFSLLSKTYTKFFKHI